MTKRNNKTDKKKKDFFDRVYELTAKIPRGKVTTYGHLAEACGIKSAARTVGWAMNGAKESNLPCHRVVNRNGTLTGRIHFGDIHLMEELLRSEGIEFDEEGNVNMKKHLWIPPKYKKGISAKKRSRS
ncbi:MAG: MGMT family protein [Ignavibacteria bacterium]|nr:MGMT family protein [Ignavibacteria bacterium]